MVNFLEPSNNPFQECYDNPLSPRIREENDERKAKHQKTKDTGSFSEFLRNLVLEKLINVENGVYQVTESSRISLKGRVTKCDLDKSHWDFLKDNFKQMGYCSFEEEEETLFCQKGEFAKQKLKEIKGTVWFSNDYFMEKFYDLGVLSKGENFFIVQDTTFLMGVLKIKLNSFQRTCSNNGHNCKQKKDNTWTVSRHLPTTP